MVEGTDRSDRASYRRARNDRATRVDALGLRGAVPILEVVDGVDGDGADHDLDDVVAIGDDARRDLVTERRRGAASKRALELRLRLQHLVGAEIARREDHPLAAPEDADGLLDRRRPPAILREHRI